MGSELSRKYDLERQPSCNGGPGGIFQIYNATKKDRTQSPVSIFYFDKKNIRNFKKQEKDQLCELLKQECVSLMKIRHPAVLQIIEPVMEDKDALAFVTEPIQISLLSMLDSTSPGFQTLKDLAEIELQCGILEIIEALTFLHNEARIVHCNLSPESIFITKNGRWKIGGLAFSNTYAVQNNQDADFPYSQQLLEYNKQILQGCKTPTVIGPNISYTGPELSKGFFQPKSDNFSLACLIYSILRAKKQEYKMSDHRLLKVTDFTEHGHLVAVQQVQREISISFSCIPENFKVPLAKLLSTIPGQRPSLNDIKNSAWFQEHKLRAIKFLESIAQKDEPQKIQFMKSLPHGLDKFEQKVLKNRILPGLLMCLADPVLTSVTLPNIMIMMDKYNMSHEQFNTQIWPHLQRMCTGKQMQAQSLFTLITHTNTLIKFVRKDDMQTVIMPVFFKAFECGKPQLQETVVKFCPDLFKTLEFQYVKSQLLPRVINLLQNVQHKNVKVECFNCIKKIWECFDRQTLQDTLFPALEKVRKSDFTPSINLEILELYEIMSSKLGTEFTGRNIIPSLIPPLIDVSFTPQQFQIFQDKISNMLKNMIDERNKIMQSQEGTEVVFNQSAVEEDIFSSSQAKNEDFFDNFFQNLPAQELEEGNTDQFDPNIFKSGTELAKSKSQNYQQIDDSIDPFNAQESQQQQKQNEFNAQQSSKLGYDNQEQVRAKTPQQNQFHAPNFQFEEKPVTQNKQQAQIKPLQNQKMGGMKLGQSNQQASMQKPNVTGDLNNLFSELASQPKIQATQQQQPQQMYNNQKSGYQNVAQQQSFTPQQPIIKSQPVQQPIQQQYQQPITIQQQIPQQKMQPAPAPVIKKNNPFGTVNTGSKKEDDIFKMFDMNAEFNFK